MNVIANLFPGFAEHRIPTEEAEIFVRTGGSGPPLLLHGYPHTHVCWHKIAPELARHVTLVLADLHGYGSSSAPWGDAEHKTYSKRSMAANCLAVMRALGHRRFTVGDYDRGGRVAYRLAFDHPEAISALVSIDILSTAVVWRA
jgi:haloacetate dehalogenase